MREVSHDLLAIRSSGLRSRRVGRTGTAAGVTAREFVRRLPRRTGTAARHPRGARKRARRGNTTTHRFRFRPGVRALAPAPFLAGVLGFGGAARVCFRRHAFGGHGVLRGNAAGSRTGSRACRGRQHSRTRGALPGAHRRGGKTGRGRDGSAAGTEDPATSGRLRRPAQAGDEIHRARRGPGVDADAEALQPGPHDAGEQRVRSPPMTARACFAILAAALALSAADGEKTRPKRAEVMGVQEDFDKRVKTVSLDDPMEVLSSAQGVYLTGYGAVFTAQVDLIVTPALNPFRQKMSPQEVERVRQRKLARLATG